MQTWAIIAQKGGQSKTTIATAFAVEAAREGAAVVILDADDRQGSALYWSERRDSDDVMVKDSSVAGLPLHVSRGRDSGKVDLIIIDTPANSKDIAMLAAEQADFVGIPVARGGPRRGGGGVPRCRRSAGVRALRVSAAGERRCHGEG